MAWLSRSRKYSDDPYADDLHVFRAARGLGVPLYAKRLEKGPLHLTVARRRCARDLGIAACLDGGRNRLKEAGSHLPTGAYRICVA